MRTVHHSVTGDSRNSPRQLHGSHRHRSLADAHRNSFTGVPFLLKVTQLPFLRGHYAAGFLGQVNPGLLPQSEGGCVFGNALNTQFLCQRVKEYVTRLVYALADIY